MKLRFVLSALALGFSTLLSAPRASAQVGIYFNPVVTHIGISTADYGPYAFLGDGTTGRFFGGVDFGGYWDFYHQPGYKLGVDIRETILHGNNAALSTFAVAPRIASSHPFHHVIPYGEVALGAGRSKAALSILHKTDLEFDILAGADLPLGKYVDFRVVELGYGTVTTMSSEIERAPTSIPAAQLFHISSGLVFRFGGEK